MKVVPKSPAARIRTNVQVTPSEWTAFKLHFGDKEGDAAVATTAREVFDRLHLHYWIDCDCVPARAARIILVRYQRRPNTVRLHDEATPHSPACP